MMDLVAALRLFERLAERGSFSVAARDLRIKQPTASKWIAELERELGAQLVQRTTRSVRITEPGRKLLAHAREVLAALDALRADVGERSPQVQGSLRVSVPVVFGQLFVVPALASFLKAHPQLNVELVLSDHYVRLVEEGFDLAVRVGVPMDSSARARKLADSRRVLVAAPSYLQARGQPREPADLRQHECLLHGDGNAATIWRFAKGPGAAATTVPVRGRFAANNSEAVAVMVRKGLGVALLADWLVRADLERGRLVALLEEFSAPAAPVYALMPPGRTLPTSVRLLVEHLVATISARMAA